MSRAKKVINKSRKYAKLALGITISLWLGLGLALAVKSFLFAPFYVPSGSMEPTIPTNTYVVIDKRPGHSEIDRGDVVVFDDPGGWMQTNPDDAALVKRVIAIAGDTVSWDEKNGFCINGVEIVEPYAQGENFSEPFSLTIPAKSLWVMGDNRTNSADSLMHFYKDETAFVPTSSVEGKVWFVYNGITNSYTINDPSPFENV